MNAEVIEFLVQSALDFVGLTLLKTLADIELPAFSEKMEILNESRQEFFFLAIPRPDSFFFGVFLSLSAIVVFVVSCVVFLALIADSFSAAIITRGCVAFRQ